MNTLKESQMNLLLCCILDHTGAQDALPFHALLHSVMTCFLLTFRKKQ